MAAYVYHNWYFNFHSVNKIIFGPNRMGLAFIMLKLFFFIATYNLVKDFVLLHCICAYIYFLVTVFV
jgi:hypothetical protein